MLRKKVNGLNYVNLDTTAFIDSFADSLVRKFKTQASTDSNSRYVDAFHENGFVWVALRSENTEGEVKP